MLIDTVVDVAQVTTAIADVPVSVVKTIVTTALTITAKSTKINVKDKGKGKAKLIEKPVKLKKKYQILFVEKVARKLQEEIYDQERLVGERARQEEEANSALIETWEDIQAKKRKKFFAAKRIAEKRNKPPTKAQQRSIMSTYLKNRDGWKPRALKNKSFAEIKELFDKAMKRINNFIDYRNELVKVSTKKDEAETSQVSSSKRARYELDQERSKNQKVEDDKESEELKKCLEIILDHGDKGYRQMSCDDFPGGPSVAISDEKVMDKMKKQKPKRKKRKEAEVSNDELEVEDHVPTPSSDPLPSGDDSFILNEIMVFCTSLQEQVLDLQEAKAAQAKKITALKRKVTKLTKWRKSRSGGLRRLKKFGSGRRVKPPMEKDSLDDETQGRINDDEMFGVDDLAGEEVVVDTITGEHEEQIIEDVSTAEPVTTAGEVVTTSTVKDSAALTTNVTEDEIQALATLKSIKPKVVVQEQKMSTTISAAATTVTITVLTPRAKANNSWDNIQAMMDADRLLAERLQAREREEFSEVQKARLSFDEINKLFDKEMRKVNDFIAMDSEAQERIINDFKELKKCIEIVPDDGDEVFIEATPLSSRSLTIIDYKIHTEGKKTYFKIIRADGNSQVYQTFEKMFKNFNREDLEVMWAIVKDRFKKEKPMDDIDNLLFRTLKTMFEHHVEDNIWKYQQGLAKVYPLTRNILHRLWSDVRLQVDYDVEMAYDLLRFIRKQLME
nr:hypothetical protein [Tanacetum cinerariifolium]